MARTREAFDEAILADLRARLAALRALACQDLAQLPAAQTDAATVLDKPVRFTVFRESHGQGKPKTRADPPATTRAPRIAPLCADAGDTFAAVAVLNYPCSSLTQHTEAGLRHPVLAPIARRLSAE
jgi:hypothetical protein